MPSPIDDAHVAAYLRALVDRAGAILGDSLIGAWLVNSGARDDYVAGSSDLDVLVGVTDGILPTRHRLADALRHDALPCPAPRLELVVYRRSVLAAPGPRRPDWELNLNTGPAIADHVGTDPAGEPAHWFVLDLSMAHGAALVLAGPPLGELLGPVPDAVVVEALRASAAWHELNDTAAPNRVLNACRAWQWLDERRWSSKTQAAAWAIEAGGDRELIELALARRLGETARPLPIDRVARFAEKLDSRLARAAADASAEFVVRPDR